ncbi:ABC transporter substrate-binding protein [Pseudonocardia ailaonensis]|uniref:ABC transporter substrate-binding protein n=1 Tax=Pseudonocardia ailaonensis TaxID=367279 RepID=UPI0031D0B87E
MARTAYTFSEVQIPVFDSPTFKGGYQPWMQLMYDTMIHETPAGAEPGLATAWTFPDDKTVELTLREGVKFQDGTPFNAAAVKFSWDRVMASTTMLKGASLKSMTAVEAPADNKVIVRLNAPYAYDWKNYLLRGSIYLSVVSPTAAQKAGDGFSANPVGAGAGPYGFASYTKGQKVTLTASPNYWDPQTIGLSGVEFVNTAGGAPTLAGLKSGSLDVAFANGGANINAAKAQGLKIANTVVRPDWNYGGYFCGSKTPFNNVAARRAVLYALNRDAFVSGPYGGYAKVNPTTIPTTSPDFPGDTVPNPYAYDVAKAKAALAAAGVAPGTTITALADPTDLNAATLQVLQSQLDAVGLKLEITPSANAFADIRTKQPDIYFQGSGFPYASQGIFFEPNGVANYCNFDNPDLTRSLAAALDTSITADQQKQRWADFQRIYYDVVPGFNLADIEQATITTSAVSGVPADKDPSSGLAQAWAGISMKK